ncbi:MAG: RHS repeat-associated core domain-containing protein [bacterium]
MPEESHWYRGSDAYQQTHLDNRLGFAGYVWDPWLKVYHVRHRVYDPFDTRWLQADPIGYAGGDTDLRRYCNGDPINYIDPMGLWPDPNWGNRLEGYITNAGAGLGDGLSFGATGVIRNSTGAGDAVDTTSGLYKGGVVTGVAFTVITTGNAAGAGAAMGTTGGAMAAGGFIGGASSLVEQNTQIGAGTRSQFDVAAVIVETVIGAAVGGIFSEASKLIGNMIRGAGGEAGAAARGAGGAAEGGGCGGGGGGGGGAGTAATGASALDDLSKAAGAMDKNGLTKAGRALQKHSDRPGSAFNNPGSKSPGSLNPAGQNVVDDILTTPGTQVKPNRLGGIDVVAPDGRGVRYNPDGSFRGFLEP